MSRPRIVCLGEALIDFLQGQGGDTFKRQPGGAPLNVACGAAKLGARAAIITMLGRDLFGDFLERIIVEHGVETSGVRRTTEANTALAFVALDARGERTFSFYRKPCADQLLRPTDLEDVLFGDDLDVFHFGSISLITEPSASATRAAAARARKAGAWVSYDPNLREPLWPDLDTARVTILSAMPLADVVKVSDGELRFLTGLDDDAGAAALLSKGPALLVVTRGARGCSIYRGGHAPVHVDAPTVRVVDTTGAGDAFVAAFLDALVRSGEDEVAALSTPLLVGAARLGNAAGALATTRYGAIPALPTREEIDELLG
ncbi:MAG: carbohydrate kinase [Deltaproteobacteria bacterium]|nr:carbohydrate kinase [Deltaproteobacteria bacterium]